MSHKIRTYCWNCSADLEVERFDGTCVCWHCGRAVVAAHDCGDSDDGDCYDYTEDPDS